MQSRREPGAARRVLTLFTVLALIALTATGIVEAGKPAESQGKVR